MSRYGKVLEFMVVSMCVLLTGLLVIIFSNMYAPSIEGALFPVVEKFTITSMTRVSPKEIIISGTFVKLRSECKLDSIVAYTTDKLRTTKTLARVDFMGIESGPNMTFRITGKQNWGPWEVHTETNSVGEDLVLTSYHDCHDLYLVPTKLIDTPMPDDKPQ